LTPQKQRKFLSREQQQAELQEQTPMLLHSNGGVPSALIFTFALYAYYSGNGF
jgi:hypothetical protein